MSSRNASLAASAANASAPTASIGGALHLLQSTPPSAPLGQHVGHHPLHQLPPIEPLHLPEATLGYVNAVTSIAQVVGAAAYKSCLRPCPLRPLFVRIVAASALLQLTQLLLIYRVNLAMGLPDVAFAMGDDAVLEVRARAPRPLIRVYTHRLPHQYVSTDTVRHVMHHDAVRVRRRRWRVSCLRCRCS